VYLRILRIKRENPDKGISRKWTKKENTTKSITTLFMYFYNIIISEANEENTFERLLNP
jgi:hypothetical protein